MIRPSKSSSRYARWSGLRSNATMRQRRRVPGRVVAGDGEQHHERADVVVGQPLPVDLGVDEVGEQIVARVGPAVPGEVGAERVEVLAGGDDRADRIGRVAERCVGPADHGIAGARRGDSFRLRHAHHVGDRPHREERRAVLDEVDVAGADEVVDDLAGRAADLVVDLAHLAPRERGAHQLAVAGVLGRVHHQEEAQRPRQVERHRVEADAEPRSEALGLAADGVDVLVPDDGPEPGLLVGERELRRRVPADRRLPPQPGERLVALVERLGPERVRRDVHVDRALVRRRRQLHQRTPRVGPASGRT